MPHIASLIMNRDLLLILLLFLRFVLVRCDIIPEDYQKDIGPYEDGRPVTVGFSMKINSVTEVNMNTMSLSFQLYFRVAWKDYRLNFPENGLLNNTSEKDSISLTTSILENIWLPDPYFEHIRKLSTFTLMKDIRGTYFYRDRTVYTSQIVKLELGCSMAFVNYPFDEQECEIMIGSYFHRIEAMEFEWLAAGVSQDGTVKELLADYDFSINQLNETTCFCAKCVPNVSPCLRTLLTLKRKYFVHLLGYYIPSSLFIGVSWCSFFWPADVIPGRTVLVITSLLTVSSMYSSSRQYSPTTSYVKALDTWMFMTIVIAVATLFQYAIVLQWRTRANEVKVKKVQPKGKTTLKVRLTMYPEIEAEVSKYRLYERRTEVIAIYGVPAGFVLFNFVYWPYYVL